MNTESHLITDPVILASGSIRRKEILESHNIFPVILPMDVDETLTPGIAPQDAVMFLALKKGLAAEKAVKDDPSAVGENEHALIISADTIVYARDITTGSWAIMGKPKDKEDAWRMLSSIRGTSHKVMTGVALISAGGARRAFCDSTNVYVNDITDDELNAYIASGEPFGKAGGYAIQLEFGKYIGYIEGDYENVVGLPYQHMLKELTFL